MIPLNQENLIRILGIENLPDEHKVEILENSALMVQQRLLLRILKGLSPEKLEEFGRVMDEGNNEALDNFISTNVPEYLNWVDEEVSSLKDELKSLTKIED